MGRAADFLFGETIVLFNIISLIVNTAAGLLGGILLLRFWMQVVHVRPPAQLGHFTSLLTDWMVLPIRRFVPGAGGYDWASLLGAWLVSWASLGIVLTFGILFGRGGTGGMGGMLAWALLFASVQQLLVWIIYGFIGLLLLEVIFSWINPQAPLAPLVRALNDPLLRPIRRVVPALGGLDLSSLVALLLLQILLQVVQSMFGRWA